MNLHRQSDPNPLNKSHPPIFDRIVPISRVHYEKMQNPKELIYFTENCTAKSFELYNAANGDVKMMVINTCLKWPQSIYHVGNSARVNREVNPQPALIYS